MDNNTGTPETPEPQAEVQDQSEPVANPGVTSTTVPPMPEGPIPNPNPDIPEPTGAQPATESQSASPTPPPSGGINKVLIFAAFFVLLVSLAAGGLFAYQNYLAIKPVSNSIPTPTASPVATPSPTPDPTADWKIYSDTKLGFEFKYPKTITLNGEVKGTDNLGLYLYTKDLKNYKDEPLGYDSVNATLDQASLEKGEYGAIYDSSKIESRNVVKLENIYGKTFSRFSMLEVCDVRFERTLIFYRNNYQIRLTLTAPVTFSKQLPSYFTSNPTNCGNSLIWKDNNTLYDDLANHKAPQVIQNWFDTFDQIISTFKLTQ